MRQRCCLLFFVLFLSLSLLPKEHTRNVSQLPFSIFFFKISQTECVTSPVFSRLCQNTSRLLMCHNSCSLCLTNYRKRNVPQFLFSLAWLSMTHDLCHNSCVLFLANALYTERFSVFAFSSLL